MELGGSGPPAPEWGYIGFGLIPMLGGMLGGMLRGCWDEIPGGGGPEGP